MTRRPQLSLVQRFAFHSFLVVSVLGLALSWGLARYIEEVLIQSSVQSTVLAIRPMMLHELRQDDLSHPMGGTRYQEFERLVAEQIRSARIARIKIWNREGMVVYSDDRSIVGRRFPVEGALRRALDGEVVFDRSNLEKEENVTERGFGQLLEVYAPLQVMESGEIIGAYEVYTYWQPINSQIWTVRYLVWGSLAAGLALLYLALFGAFRDASQVIRRQRDEMESLYAEARRRLHELSTLFEVSHTLRKARNVEEMLPIILDRSVEAMDAEGGHLALLKNEGRELAIQATRALSPTSKGQQLDVAGLSSACPARTGRPAVCPPGCPLYSSEHTFICAPVASPEGVIGTLSVSRTGDWPLPNRAIRLLTTIAELAGNAIHRAALHEELEKSYVQTVLALANAIDVRDSYTAGHGERLAVWATAVARELSCSEEEIELVRWGALLHDVGKIGVPDHILLKPGSLNDEERAMIQRHPEIGGKIVEPVKRLRAVAPIICHHHERWDGTGYPAGLKGEQIPLEARILAVVDAYGAITDERVYSKARSHAEAVEELRRNAGSQFDPQVVEAFLRVVNMPLRGSLKHENGAGSVADLHATDLFSE